MDPRPAYLFCLLSPLPCFSHYGSILIIPRTCLIQVASSFHNPRFDGHSPWQRLLWLPSPSFLKHLLSWPSRCYALFLQFSTVSLQFPLLMLSSLPDFGLGPFSLCCVTQVRARLASDCPCSRIAPASSWNSDPDLPSSYLAPLQGKLMDILSEFLTQNCRCLQSTPNIQSLVKSKHLLTCS